MRLPGCSSLQVSAGSFAEVQFVGGKEKGFADPAKSFEVGNFGLWQDPTIIFVAGGPVAFAFADGGRLEQPRILVSAFFWLQMDQR